MRRIGGQVSQALMLGTVCCMAMAGCARSPHLLVVDPTVTGTLPNGNSVSAVLVVPEENVVKGEAWEQWDAQYPRRYRLRWR